MGAGEALAPYEEELREERRRFRRRCGAALAVGGVTLGCAAATGLLDLGRLAVGLPSIALLLRESVPPDFHRGAEWLRPLLETLVMSVSGTAVAVALALPLGCLAARNVAPHAAVYWGARGLLNTLRSIPELILGIFFVAAVGFGPLPGVLALGLHSAGMVGKFFAESIEHVDPGPVEAMRAVGARPLQVVFHGILPQVLPQMADVSIYRWEYHVRASTVIGLVGAGGIGAEIISALRLMQYREVGALLLTVMALVWGIDALSARLRSRFQ